MKKLFKDSMNMTKTGILLGVGANTITGLGGNAAGINALGNQMPIMGSVMGMGYVFGSLKKLKK